MSLSTQHYFQELGNAIGFLVKLGYCVYDHDNQEIYNFKVLNMSQNNLDQLIRKEVDKFQFKQEIKGFSLLLPKKGELKSLEDLTGPFFLDVFYLMQYTNKIYESLFPEYFVRPEYIN